MSIFDKLVSDLSGQSKKRNVSNYSTEAYGWGNTPSNQVKMVWQCAYCGRRANTYGNNVPSAGLCSARGKSIKGFSLPHEWRRLL